MNTLSTSETNASKVAAFRRALPQEDLTCRAELARYGRLLAEEYAEVREELNGFQQAAAPRVEDAARLAQELTDLIYVAYGALHALGVDPDLAFETVHRANMHKLRGGQFRDGKPLKPLRWTKPDLRPLIPGVLGQVS